MDKKLPLGNVVRTVCHYSTCQNVKFNSSGFNKRHKAQIVAIINGAKNINHHDSFVTSVGRYPRSYAEMIADYSEALHKASIVGGRNDSLYFDNTIRKSPFSTFSTPSSVKKIVNVTQHNGIPIEGQENYSSLPDDTIEPFDRCIHGKINIVKCHGFQHHDTRIAKAINKANSQDCRITNDLKDDDHSYVKFVANCSKSMHDISLANVSNGGLVSSKNALARNSLESFVTLRKANSANTQEALRKTPPSVATMPLEKNVKEQLIVPEERNWLKEIESVTSDLKSVIEKRAARAVDISKLEESDTPQFVAASDNSPHKVRRLTKLIKAHEQKERDATVKRPSYQSDKVEKHSKDFALQKHNYSQSHSKTSNPQYFSSMSSPARKTSTHVSTRSVLKQPHVKLRMVPSEKESVVSINVDSVSTGLSNLNPTSKQLSVVVQSDRREDPQSMENQWAVSTLRRGAKSAPQRNDFGPMRISISEDSAPVKQIEFSINGKPVSELKSITARTERLDVVSSMDKIEIRIPFVKDEAPSKIGETDLSKVTDSSTGQILNVQISANFQNESVKGSVEKSTRETTRHQDKDKIPASSSPISKSYYSFNDSVRAHENTFGSHKLSNPQQHGFSNNTIEKSINDKVVDDIEFNIQTAKSLSPDKTTNISFNEGRNNIEMKNLNIKKTMNTIRSPMNKYDKNESSDHRVPSKMIPWWSSSDSFNKIKKKKDDSKPLAPSSNRSEKKMISNLSLFTESLPSKETILTKKIQSINDATTTINNLSNLTLYSNSVEQYVKSKPTVHCSYSFKPNNLNTIPNIPRNNLKSKDNQRSTIQEDKKIVGIIQTKPIALTTSDATNTGKQDDASKREKASLLQEKTLNSAQNLPSNRNLEKEDNYFLKQTKSIDDVFGTKSKMENTLDALKLMEKRKDSSIDYGLKISRKSTMKLNKIDYKLNSRVREIQSPPAGTIRTKDLISSTSATEIKEQIVKTIPAKQTLDKTKKSEPKMNILKLKENLTIKNVATSDLNQQKKNDVKNIQIHQNEVTTSNSKNFLKSTLKKQDKLAKDAIVFQNNPNQDNKNSLLEYNKDKPSSSSNIRISSGTIKESEKLGMSVKVPLEELKQNRQNSLSNIKSTLKTIQANEKLRSLTPPKFKEPLDKKMNQKKSSLEIINEIQTKYNANKITNIDNQSQTKPNSKLITSKIENHICKNSMDKNAMPDKFVKRINEKNNAEDKTLRTLTQNPKNKNSLLKNCEKNPNKSKSGKDKRNPSKSADSLSRKSPDFKSADSKTKPTVMSNDNCTCERKSMLTEPLYPNFNRRDDTISNSQSIMFKSPRNLHNDVLEYRSPRIIGSARSWINIDRPEKNMLYSVWLQQSRDDINKNKKLF